MSEEVVEFIDLGGGVSARFFETSEGNRVVHVLDGTWTRFLYLNRRSVLAPNPTPLTENEDER